MSQGVEQGKFEVFDASHYKVGIVSAQFNRDVADAVLSSTLTLCEKYGVKKEHISIYKVPGSVEIPVILKAMAETKKYHCLIALGTVIRGETPHFEYVAKIISEGVLRVMMDYGIPVGFGILTCENKAQAMARIDHAGAGAAEAALQSAHLIRSF